MTLKRRYCEATPFANFLEGVEANADLWGAVARRVQVPDDAVQRVRALGQRWHLLVLAEDWCGDAVNTLPVLAKLADLAENLDLRVLSRDANPDLMDSHLAPNGARAVPVVITLDAEFIEIRRWYARDRGATTLDEVIGLLERGTTNRRAA